MATKRMIQKAAKRAYDLMAAIERDGDGNPTTLEGAIRAVILKSPNMHQYRDDALDTIYCVLGSGIDWNEHGRLGDHMPNNYMNMPPDVGGQGIWSEEFGFDDTFKGLGKWANKIRKEIKQENNKRMEGAIRTIEEIDIRVKRYRRNRKKWYPISWYASHIVCPENVQLDFLDGAIETARLIIDTRVDIGTEEYWRHQCSVKYATQMLKLLETQKKQRKQNEGNKGNKGK